MNLRDFTPARVSQGRTGASLPTRELLEFQLAHAHARDAVHARLDPHTLALELRAAGRECLVLRSAAPDRATYLRRPDLGRRLSAESRGALRKTTSAHVYVVADGLSALAVQRHAPALLSRLDPGPVVIVEQGRVAIGDEIGEAMGASLVAVLIGERPGLSSPDSLGVYLTWHPRLGRTDAERNCLSNIRAEGLSYDLAAHKLKFLMDEAARRKLTGVDLKEDAPDLLPAP
jgi:ethanolamine ammonia-lyase small subunit